MPQPALASYAQRMYELLEPVAFRDEQNGWALANFVGALGLPFQVLEDLAVDAPGSPGWTLLFDPNRIPASGLPWLAQLIGVQLQAGWTEAQQRQAISSHLGWERGSRAGMVSAIQVYLTGSKDVVFVERDTSPYHFFVATRTNQTPPFDGSINPLIVAAINSQKPAGLQYTYNVIAGLTFDELDASAATFDALDAANPTFADLES